MYSKRYTGKVLLLKTIPWDSSDYFPGRGGEATWTYMLSQNLVRVLGFSWLRLCRNQRWMLRTSQSSCLESPSNLFSSGCCEAKHQRNHFHPGLLMPCTGLTLPMVGVSIFYSWHFNLCDYESSLSTQVRNKDRSWTTHYETRQTNKNLAPAPAFFFLSASTSYEATSNQERVNQQPAGWVSSIGL